MCSVLEEDFDDEIQQITLNENLIDTLKDITQCSKCKNNRAIVKLAFKSAECKDCFLAAVRHKFRATLGSSKILPKNSSVMVVFDGGPEANVLLDMLSHAQTENTYKRLHCKVDVLYIDEYFLNKTKKDILQEIRKLLQKYAFEIYIISLASRSEPEKLSAYSKDKSVVFEEEFLCFVNNLISMTSKQDLVEQTKKNLIRKSAKHLGCNLVFMPDTSPNLATTLLKNISLGRGGSTAFDVSLIDDRFSDLKIVRPLKDLTEDEIENYVKVQNLDYISTNYFGKESGEFASIQNLTKKFVRNLQENYSSTVSTVFRTGDKIKSKEPSAQMINEDNSFSSKCCFCHAQLDNFDSKTLLAVEFSRAVSKAATNDLNHLDSIKNEAKQSLQNNRNNERNINQLCHGCSNIFYNSNLDSENILKLL